MSCSTLIRLGLRLDLQVLSKKDAFVDAAWSHTANALLAYRLSSRAHYYHDCQLQNHFHHSLSDMVFMHNTTWHVLQPLVPLQLHVACSPAAASAAASVEEAKVLQDSVPEPCLEPLWTASNWRCGPCTWSHQQKLWLPWMHGCSRWQTVQHKWVAEKHWMCWKDTLITESCWEAFSD